MQQDKSYHVRVMTTADEGKAFFGKCYNCGEPGHPWCERREEGKEGPAKGEEEVKPKRACWSEGRPCPQSSSSSCTKLRAPRDTPCTYWNEDARDWWLGPENLGQTLIDGEPVTALIDNGTRVNMVTPAFVKKRGLEVGSIADLKKH